MREATIHQSSTGDLAIRQGPWKMVFLKNGQRELYNLETDLSESQDVRSSNLELAAQLTTRMQSYIDRGRSNAGVSQTNEFDLTIEKSQVKPKAKVKR